MIVSGAGRSATTGTHVDLDLLLLLLLSKMQAQGTRDWLAARGTKTRSHDLGPWR